ncbi:hypothetical protein P3S67_010448 [Capsicum chacoense]
MDGQKSQRRSQSSLLRSSPTIRSSIHNGDDQEPDIEEQKPHKIASTPVQPVLSPFNSGPTMIAVSFLFIYALFYFFKFKNLLLSLIFIAIFLFLSRKYKRKLGLMSNNSTSKVKWFIGERIEKKKAIIAKEGVEVYNNGDVYEGEFHKGKCNGSGVYTFSVNGGKYEGDWIDAKYDGYGVECWTRGSKYRGQYGQGRRHGYGVYKFFNGDSYAGMVQWTESWNWGTELL